MMTQETLLALGPVQFFLLTVFSFLFLYLVFTYSAYVIFTRGKYFLLFQQKAFKKDQLKTEVRRSMVSILMFGVLSLPLYQGLKHGFLNIRFEFSPVGFVIETLVLFFWNEIYFYTAHRIFHLAPLYKFHFDHHYSVVPSPFAAYSFHWTEGLVLGAVMPVIMCFHDFQVYSLLTLPVMSIAMNTLGHSNVDFFPGKPLMSILSFSKRHSMHHKYPQSNFGFFLPYFDQLFNSHSDT